LDELGAILQFDAVAVEVYKLHSRILEDVLAQVVALSSMYLPRNMSFVLSVLLAAIAAESRHKNEV
jgi:hypothetical protein